MDEAVLRRQIGGPETMHAQLQRLIAATELPNVTLLVMPDSLGAHPGMDGPLAILQFETGTRPVVYVESQAGNLYMEKDDDLRRSQQIMNHILAAAPGPDHSLALIRQAAKEIKPLAVQRCAAFNGTPGAGPLRTFPGTGDGSAAFGHRGDRPGDDPP